MNIFVYKSSEICNSVDMTLEEFRTARAATKRASVLRAAETCFRKEGFMRTSMETVARDAQVSTATLYRYFSSKEDLFEAVATDTMDRLVLDADVSSKGADGLDILARAYAKLLSEPETRGLFRMVVSECGRDKELALRFYTAVKSRLSDLFIMQIEAGVKAGTVKEVTAPDHVAGQLQGMIEHATLMRGLVLGDDIETMSEAEFIADDALATWRIRWGT